MSPGYGMNCEDSVRFGIVGIFICGLFKKDAFSWKKVS